MPEVDELEKNTSNQDEAKQSKAEATEAAAMSDSPENSSSGGWDTNVDGKKPRFRFGIRRKQALIGTTIASLLVGGAIGISSILSGPAQAIQIAEMLSTHFLDGERTQDSRWGKMVQWAKTRQEPERRNMGFWGNKIADHYQKKLAANGMTPDYQDGSGRIRGIEIDASTVEGRRSLEKMRAAGYDIPDPDTSGKTRLNLEGESARARRQAISAMTSSLDVNGVSTSVASRTLKIRAAVDFHPLKNIARSADEDFRAYVDKIKKERAERIQDGTAPDTRTGDTRPQDDPDNPANQDAVDAENEARAGIDDIESTATAPGETQAKVDNLRGKLGAGIGATAVLGTLCGLQALGNESANIQELNVVLPSIRVGMNIIAMGSQAKSGVGINMDELGAATEDFYDVKSKSSIFDGESVQAEIGNEKTGVKIADSAKPGKDKPGFFKAIDAVLVEPLASACGVINSTFGGIALTISGIALTATGPAGAAVSLGAEVAQDVALGAVMDDVVRWISGDPLDIAGLAGGQLGEVANHGAFLAANSSIMTAGATTKSAAERVSIINENREELNREMKAKPLYARLFDTSNPHSLVSKSIIQNTEFKNTQTTMATLLKTPVQTFGKIGKSFSAVLPGVSAATTPFDYGVDKVAFSPAERDNPRYDNPYENADRIEGEPGKLDRLNKDYGEVCFGSTVNPTTGSIEYGKAPTYQDLEINRAKCTDPNNQELMDYRFYLLDKVTMTSMLCYEGLDDQSCEEIGMSNNAGQTQSGNANIYVLGDSLTAGMKTAGLDAKLTAAGWIPTSNGVVGRLISGGQALPDGVTQIQQDSATASSAGTIVVGLGTNHWGQNEEQFKSELEKMRAKVKEINSSATIWWINYYGTGKFTTPLANHTSTLSSFAQTNNDRVVDWASTANQYFTSAEDVHPNDYNAMADFVVQALGPPPISVVGGTPAGQPTDVIDISQTAVTRNGGGIRVHTSIVQQLESMIDAAAADGINLTGSGYRDSAGQIAVRRTNCGTSNYDIYEKPASECSPPTAIPGRSMHERGLAIDFDTSQCGSRSTPCFKWLAVNAERYGFKNLPSEPWHWSTNGN